MKYERSLSKTFKGILFTLLLVSISLNYEIVSANSEEIKYIYETSQTIPEKNDDNDEEMIALTYEISHKKYPLAKESNWDVSAKNLSSGVTMSVTNWFEQKVTKNGSMTLKIKDEYIESGEIYGNEYHLKATTFFESKYFFEKELTPDDFDVYQSINEVSDDVRKKNNDKSEEGIKETDLLKLNTVEPVSADPRFTYDEATVRELFEIGSQFERETNINNMQLVFVDTLDSKGKPKKGSVLRFHPNYNMHYMMYTFSNGLDDASSFITPEESALGSPIPPTVKIEDFKPFRGIFPMLTDNESNLTAIVNPNSNPSDSLASHYRQGGNGVTGKWNETNLAVPMYFKDSNSSILKGVIYDPQNKFLMETTLSLDLYTGSGSVKGKLLNVQNKKTSMAIYEMSDWQTNWTFVETIPKVIYSADGKTPLGYDYKLENEFGIEEKSLEYTRIFRNRDATFIGDNRYFYSGIRNYQLLKRDGVTDAGLGEIYMKSFPFRRWDYTNNKYKIFDPHDISHDKPGEKITVGDGANQSTSIQTNEKVLDYGESVEYGYDYYFGKLRKGLSIENGTNNFVLYEDADKLANTVEITNPNLSIAGAQVNLLVDGKAPITLATNQVLEGPDKKLIIPYTIDISDWGPGLYKGRIEVVHGPNKAYGPPISINLQKTFNVDFDLDRTLTKKETPESSMIGHDYISIVNNSLILDERYEDNLSNAIFSYPKNTELLFWNDQEDISEFVTQKLGRPTLGTQGDYQTVTYSPTGTVSHQDINIILSSVVLKTTTRGEVSAPNSFRVELVSKDNKSKTTTKKIPGAIKVSYLDADNQKIDVTNLDNVPDYIYGTYKIGDKLPEFKLEVDETDKTEPYYPTISGYEFIRREPAELIVAEANQKVNYIYKKSQVNMKVNYYQWINGQESEKKVVDNLDKGTRKKGIDKPVPLENKTIQEFLDTNKAYQAPTVDGYVFSKLDTQKTRVSLDSAPDKVIPLTEKMPQENFTINYYYEPTVKLEVPTGINFGVREKKEESKVYGMVPSKAESDNRISIIDTYETSSGIPDWTLYASTEGFFSKETGVRLLADLELRTPDFTTPKTITRESTPLFINNPDFEKNISLVDEAEEDGLYIKVAKVQEIGKYSGVLKYKLQTAP